MKALGKPAIVRPRYERIPSFQISARSVPVLDFRPMFVMLSPVSTLLVIRRRLTYDPEKLSNPVARMR